MEFNEQDSLKEKNNPESRKEASEKVSRESLEAEKNLYSKTDGGYLKTGEVQTGLTPKEDHQIAEQMAVGALERQFPGCNVNQIHEQYNLDKTSGFEGARADLLLTDKQENPIGVAEVKSFTGEIPYETAVHAREQMINSAERFEVDQAHLVTVNQEGMTEIHSFTLSELKEMEEGEFYSKITESQSIQEASENLFSKLEPMIDNYKEMLNLTEDQKNEMLANVYKEAGRNPDFGEMLKLADSDIYHEHTQTQFSFEVSPDETPMQALDRILAEKEFHPGEHENTPLEIMDGIKGDYDYQRFKDVEGGLQEHIRFNEPIENADGSYTINIIGETHRDASMEAVYGEGKSGFGDLEPFRKSVAHMFNTLEWLKQKH